MTATDSTGHEEGSDPSLGLRQTAGGGRVRLSSPLARDGRTSVRGRSPRRSVSPADEMRWLARVPCRTAIPPTAGRRTDRHALQSRANTTDDGRRAADGGPWTVDGGRWTVDGGR